MALEERLELDVSEALRGVDSIGAALDNVAQSFKVNLAEALDLLGTVTVGEVDASAVTAGIDAAVQSADLAPAIEADTAGVTTAIDEAVSAADGEVPVEADTSGVGDAITAAIDDADTSVEVSAQIDALQDQIEQAVADADATVEIDADTSQAEDQIEGLGDTAAGAAGDVGGLNVGVGQLGALSDAATGSLAGLEGGLAATNAKAGVAAGAVAAVGGATLALFHAALDSDTATRRFNSALGDMAQRVEGIKIEGFADNLGELAERAGQDDEALRLAAARIADLGNSAGASQEQIAGAAENILLVATRAAVMNPTLGQAGDVADRMTNAFARGGRALAPFGIALSSAEINARALADTGKASADQLSIFEKAAAGAAIVTEQLGGHLKTDIVEGAKGTEISLRSLREQFQNTLEELGKPLLQPIVEAIREGQPILLDLAEVLGQLAVAILPVFVAALRAGAPIVSALATATSVLIQPLALLAQLVASIPTPFLTAAAAAVGLRLAFVPLVQAMQTGVTTAAIGVRAGLAALVSPMGLVTVAVGILATAWADHAKKQAESNARVRQGAEAFQDEATAIEDAVAAIAKEAIPKNQEDDIRRLGLSFKQVGDLAREGKTGLADFLDEMVRAGQISRNVADAFLETGDSSGRLVADADALGLHTENLSAQNLALVDTFKQLQKEQQQSARDALEDLVNTDQLTAAQKELVNAVLDSTSGNIDYVGVLKDVKPSSEDAADGADALTQSLADQEQASKDAEDALNSLLDAQIGFLDSSIAAESAALKFRDSLDDVKVKADAVTEAIARYGRGSDEATTAQRALDDAIRDARDAALSQAEAALRAADDQAKANNTFLTAKERQDVFRSSLQAAADQANGPTKDAILGLIGTYDALPDNVNTVITADTRNAVGAIDSLQAKLSALDRNIIIRGGVGGAFMAGGVAEGGDAGQFITVGERGRELVFVAPNTTATVFPNHRTEDILAGGGSGGGSTFNIFPKTDSVEELAFALDARLGGRRR